MMLMMDCAYNQPHVFIAPRVTWTGIEREVIWQVYVGFINGH